VSGTATSPTGQPVWVFAFEFNPSPGTGVTLSCPGASSTDFSGPNGSPECLFSSPVSGTAWSVTNPMAWPSPLSVLVAYSFDNQTYQTFGSPLAVSAPTSSSTPPATTIPTESSAGGLGNVNLGSGGGVNGGLLGLGAAIVALCAGALLFAGGKPPCSCAAEYAAWQAAIEAVKALEQREIELASQARLLRDQITQKQAERAHWDNQVVPFQLYIAQVEQYLDELNDLDDQLHSMTGALGMAGTLSSTPKPGWTKVGTNVWAENASAGKGAEAAVALYEEVCFNGMIGPAIWRDIMLTEWRIGQAQQQLATANADLTTIENAVAACDVAIGGLRDQLAANTAETKTVDAQLVKAKAEQDRTLAAYDACKKQCPGG
jgi:hypothetical protein